MFPYRPLEKKAIQNLLVLKLFNRKSTFIPSQWPPCVSALSETSQSSLEPPRTTSPRKLCAAALAHSSSSSSSQQRPGCQSSERSGRLMSSPASPLRPENVRRLKKGVPSLFTHTEKQTPLSLSLMQHRRRLQTEDRRNKPNSHFLWGADTDCRLLRRVVPLW